MVCRTLLHNINEAHCRALAKSSLNYKYVYTSCMKTLEIFSVTNDGGEAFANAPRNIHELKFLKQGCCLLTVDERNRPSSL